MPKADWPSMCSSIHCRLGSSASAPGLQERSGKTWGGAVKSTGAGWGWEADSFPGPAQPEGWTQLMGGREES